MRRAAQFLFFLLAASGLFLFFNASNTVNLSLSQLAGTLGVDIEPQKPLRESLPAGRQAPEIIKAIYSTGWSAGSEKRLNYLIKLIKETELNAIVIDIKDYSGELSYLTEIKEAEKYGKNREIKILRPNAMIKKLHDEGIYVIARQTVFQDPVLAKARPDLALTS